MPSQIPNYVFIIPKMILNRPRKHRIMEIHIQRFDADVIKLRPHSCFDRLMIIYQLTAFYFVSLTSDIDIRMVFRSADDKNKKKDTVKFWPHWCLYVGWTICILTTVTAGFFTLLYGLSFGRVMQEEWLVSFFTSIFQDIFVSQPSKVKIRMLPMANLMI